jgi:hypothetical protein
MDGGSISLRVWLLNRSEQSQVELSLYPLLFSMETSLTAYASGTERYDPSKNASAFERLIAEINLPVVHSTPMYEVEPRRERPIAIVRLNFPFPHIGSPDVDYFVGKIIADGRLPHFARREALRAWGPVAETLALCLLNTGNETQTLPAEIVEMVLIRYMRTKAFSFYVDSIPDPIELRSTWEYQMYLAEAPGRISARKRKRRENESEK